MSAPVIGQIAKEELLMERNYRVEIRHPSSWTFEQRNRKSLQMYFWLNERIGRDAWCLRFANNECGSRHLFYFVPKDIILLFKLTWAGAS